MPLPSYVWEVGCRKVRQSIVYVTIQSMIGAEMQRVYQSRYEIRSKRYDKTLKKKPLLENTIVTAA